MTIVCSYGGGTNSTALIVEAFNRGIHIDHIIFADTGSEMPHTYAFLEEFKTCLGMGYKGGCIRGKWGIRHCYGCNGSGQIVKDVDEHQLRMMQRRGLLLQKQEIINETIKDSGGLRDERGTTESLQGEGT